MRTHVYFSRRHAVAIIFFAQYLAQVLDAGLVPDDRNCVLSALRRHAWRERTTCRWVQLGQHASHEDVQHLALVLPQSNTLQQPARTPHIWHVHFIQQGCHTLVHMVFF